MKTTRLITLYAAVMLLAACGDDGEDVIVQSGGGNTNVTSGSNENRNTSGPLEARYRMEFPHLKGEPSVVVVHKAILNKNDKEKGINYSVEWDPNINAQRWSCYQMYSSVNYHPSYNVTRYYASNNGSLAADCQYPNDQDLPAQLQMTADPYKNNGYDHGHICPSADRQRAEEANYQTFFITNLQPQYKNFNGSNDDGEINNRSPWYRLEMQVRSWTSSFDTLYVCKGGTIDNGRTLGTLKDKVYGKNIIPIPRYFFVALCGKKGSSYKAIGFWMEHVSSYSERKPLSTYAYSIDELESKTGIDFFCNLPDAIEKEVEKSYRASDWSGNLQ